MIRRPVITDWEPRNEYTTPLVGKVIYRNEGIIKAVTKDGTKISVGKISYEQFDEENYQYIITPFWSIDEKDFSVLIPILRAQVTMNQQKMKKAQRKGIEKSKSENRYQGRKKKEVDFIKLEESYKKFKLGRA